MHGGTFLTKRLRAGYFTAKITSWEKWHEPIHKVEPESACGGLHTVNPVHVWAASMRSEHHIWLTVSVVCHSGTSQRCPTFFEIIVMLAFFFRQDDWVQVLPRLHRRCVSPNFFLPACQVVIVVVTGFAFTSKYIGCEFEASSFLPGRWHLHSQLSRKWSKLKFQSSPEVGDAWIVMPPFFILMVYVICKCKVEQSLRKTHDYVSTLRIPWDVSINHPQSVNRGTSLILNLICGV